MVKALSKIFSELQVRFVTQPRWRQRPAVAASSVRRRRTVPYKTGHIFFFEIHTVSELALDVIADNPEAEFVDVLLYKSEAVCWTAEAKLGDSDELLFPVGDTEAG